MVTTMEKTLQELASAWSSHDWNKVSPLYTDDCIYEDVGLGKVYHGKQEIKGALNEMLTGFPDFKFEFKSSIKSGNWVAGEWVMSGTHTGSMPGMPGHRQEIFIAWR